MRVDVADLGGGEAGVVERLAHRVAGAGGIWGRQLRPIGVQPGARELGQDRCTPCLGVVPAFQHQYRRAFAHHEAGAVEAEGPAAFGAEHAQRLPAFQHPGRDRGIGPAGHGDVELARADQHRRLRDRVAGAGARGRDGEADAAQLELHGNLRAGGVGHHPRHRQRRHAVRSLAVEAAVGVIERELPHGRTEHDTVPPRAGSGDRGLRHRLARGHQRELRYAIELVQAVAGEMPAGIELHHLRRERGAEALRVDAADWTDADDASDQVGPDGRHGGAERADRAHAGDRDAPSIDARRATVGHARRAIAGHARRAIDGVGLVSMAVRTWRTSSPMVPNSAPA